MRLRAQRKRHRRARHICARAGVMNSGRYSLRSSGRNDGGEGYGTTRPGGRDIAAGDVLLAVEDVSLAFGGVKAVTGVSFDIRKGEIRAIIGPNGAGKTLDAQRHQRLLSAPAWPHHFQGQAASAHASLRGGAGGHRPHVPERRPVQGHDGARQHHGGAHAEDAPRLVLAAVAARAGADAKRSSTATASRRSSTSSRSSISARSRSASCPTACRSGSSSAARLRWSPISCCSTSRWPA